ncbi:MAG: AAA family ATPase [Candidatus Competibacteraceae bacterium]|nr:AAA family ATPase [Candidatus Competibacteraceae bacterium]
MIRTIKIDGFKSLASMSFDLGRVNCLIGANGVGKSNILEAIGVLGAAANGTVDDESLLRRGVRPGVPGLYKTSFATARTPAHIGLSALGAESEEYRISILNPLENPSPAWAFKTEYLTDGSTGIVSDGVRNKKNLTPTAGLAALQIVEIDADSPAFKLMRRLQGYAIYSPNTPTLRAMITDQQSRDPVGLSGGRLAEAFADLRRTTLDKDEDLLDSVFDLIDWVEDIETTHAAGSLLSPSIARAKEVLKFTDRFMKKSRNSLTAYDASEGALYVLFCAILCLSPQAPKLFAVDNLDQALNPRLVTRLTSKLGIWLKHADRERQLLFTAHNPAVLDGLDLLDDDTRLFAVDRNSSGHTQIKRIELSDKLLVLNKDYPLSRLWLMGHLGAVPNV